MLRTSKGIIPQQNKIREGSLLISKFCGIRFLFEIIWNPSNGMIYKVDEGTICDKVVFNLEEKQVK